MKHAFKPGRRAGISAMAALALASTSQIALAGTLDGPRDSHTVNPGDQVESWTLTGGATLTVNGQTNQITATQSNVVINGGAVTSGGSNGLRLQNGSHGTFTGATITNTGGTALSIGNHTGEPGFGSQSSAQVFDSAITGLGVGVIFSGMGALDLSRSVVTGLDEGGTAVFSGGTGLRMANGVANISNGSRITGDRYGIHIIEDLRGSPADFGREINIDGSTVEGKTGPAIRVGGFDSFPTDAAITVSNGSTLVGGNGDILEVSHNSSADFTVDNSHLTGNVLVDDTSSADITIQNNGSIKGTFTGVDELKLNSGGTWKLIGDDSMANLAMGGGVVEISEGSGSAFNTLTVGTLSGSGTFLMGTNISALEGDKLVVTEADGATGDHTLHVKNTGVDPTTDDVLTVVETNGGGADFGLLGDAVDLGVYKYYLEQRGDDWVLVGSGDPADPGDGGDLTPGAQTVIGLHAAAANVFYGELGTLRQRMGDVRLGNGENGIWGRTYGRDLKGNGAAGVDFDQSMWGMQAGAETEIYLGGIPIVFGAFGGYSNSTVDLAGKSQGKIDSGYGGVYATWLGNDGLYVDGLFKVNRFSNDARVVMSDGSGSRGDYNATGVGGQIEIGKTFDLGNGWYAEPFAQIAAVRIGSFDYHLDNGMNADGDAYGSLQGRIGATIGFNHKLENGALLQPYLRFAVAQEFVDNNKLRINTVGFDNSFDGTRGEVGAGFAYQLNEALQIHADIDFSAGKGIDRNWGGNLGVSYKF